ncbi:hypothetical protein PUN28_005763 [Cardiocondyla obscurior]|uniref:Uncharacterized protein n=1 Tax=Cardiocondyla obscurior TaxID=286306 RepID=A0AAW2G5C6_9HYME
MRITRERKKKKKNSRPFLAGLHARLVASSETMLFNQYHFRLLYKPTKTPSESERRLLARVSCKGERQSYFPSLRRRKRRSKVFFFLFSRTYF